MDRWPDTAARARAIEVFQRLNTLDPTMIGAEELTPQERPFLRFDADAQERFAGWRAELEHHLRAEEDHPVVLSHFAKYRSLMPSLALLFHVIDAVDGGSRGPIPAAAAARAIAWCEYLAAQRAGSMRSSPTRRVWRRCCWRRKSPAVSCRTRSRRAPSTATNGPA